MHRRKVHNTSLVIVFLKLQILSVCSPEVLIKSKLKTSCEVVNIPFNLPCHQNPLVRYKRNQADILLRTNQKSNIVIPFLVILPHLKGKEKGIIFSKPSYVFMTFFLFNLPCIVDSNVLHWFSFGYLTTNFQYVQFDSITGTQFEFTKNKAYNTT